MWVDLLARSFALADISLVEQARNLAKQSNMPLSISHYLNNMSKLTNQWNNQNYKEPDRQRIYLKDIDCPKLWHDKLKKQIPPSIFYLNDSTAEVGRPGALNAHDKGIARCGDLMSCLSPEMRADNMMCYIGHEGTYTPAHREMCASLGQNLMVDTSGLRDDEGKPTKPGSSIWFMTETNDRHLVSEYWLSVLGHDIEVEKHFAQINAWKNAPFTTYVVEQKAGDFILIPPLAPHQVWNRGTRTMKVAWNRSTVETLEMALHEALPRARMVCRDEQYKNKAMIYFALHRYSDLLKQADLQMHSTRNPQAIQDLKYNTKIRQLQKDFKRLFVLYTEILLSEMLSPVSPSEKRGQYLPYESFITCSYCRCNIFNRFLTCTTCVAPLPNADEDTYDVCMDCFAMGRSCACISAYKWVEQFPWQDLVQKHELWRQLIVGFEGVQSDKSPKTLQAERKHLKKKTLAQVCQEQLKIRPWSDPKNPRQPLTAAQKRDVGKPATDADGDGELDAEGQPKKKKINHKRKENLDKDFVMEHVSLHPEEKWKVATCSKCDRAYSYGSLWRMFDLMPLAVMENPEWECPFCLKICSCGSCRSRHGMKAFEPKGTVLGHETKKVADTRSVEHLVDFSRSNMNWIKAAGDDAADESRRLNRRIEEAEIAKARDPTLDDNYVDDEGQGDGLFVDSAQMELEIPIDPMLSMDQPPRANGSIAAVNRRLPSRPSTNDQGTATDGGLDASSVYGSRIDLRPPTGNVPTAILSEEQPQNFVSNGITYEYPDPTEGSQPTPSKHASQSNQPDQKQASTVNGKRKSSEYNLLQTNMVTAPAPRDHSNNVHLSQNQIQQTLQEAKDNNRSAIVEAALTGKQLLVSFSLPASTLATVARSHPSNAITNGPRTAAKELLQSDLPDLNHAEQHAEGSKKRKNRTEEDNDRDFKIRQRDRPSTTSTAAAEDVRGCRARYAAVDTSSEDEDVLMRDPEDASINKPQGPRPLPKYLAKRSEGQDLPSELPIEEPRRKSLPSAARANNSGQFTSSRKEEARASLPVKGVSKTDGPSTAERLAEENRKAKMKAVSWADGGEEEQASSSDRSSSEDEQDVAPRVKKARKLMAVPPSMFSRPGMAGKKFKIASAKTAGLKGSPAPTRGRPPGSKTKR